MSGARPSPGIVVFGDVVASREAPTRATTWLRTLARALDARYAEEQLARWEFTQGDEIQGLLGVEADPLEAVLQASLTRDAPRMRWVIVAGDVEEGAGPATQRAGPAFVEARRAIIEAGERHDSLLVLSGDPRADDLLASMAPVLGGLLDGLTPRQREVAYLTLIDGLTHAEVAQRLGVARATVSISYARAGGRSIARMRHAVMTVFREGVQVAQAARMVPP